MKYFIKSVFYSLAFSIFLNICSNPQQYGFAQMQGRRKTMEDAHYIEIQKNSAFFGEYDGHGGKAVAGYVANKLHQNIFNDPNFKTNIEKAMFDGYIKTHNDLDATLGNFVAANEGTTAVSAIFEDNKIYIANSGDSRAVLSSNGIAIPLSVDHKPDNPNERARILKLGGQVGHFGVMRVLAGNYLAVSRSIGDKSSSPFVIPDPEIKIRNIEPSDQFLILACDGVWDVFNNQQAVDIVQKSLAKVKDYNVAANELIQAAYNAGSTDNISAIIVDVQQMAKIFDAEKKIKEEQDKKLLAAKIAAEEKLKAQKLAKQKAGKKLAQQRKLKQQRAKQMAAKKMRQQKLNKQKRAQLARQRARQQQIAKQKAKARQQAKQKAKKRK